MKTIYFHFQEFLFFVLPLVNFQRIKNYVMKKLVLTASKQKLSQDAPRDLTSCAICSNWPIRPQEIGCQHVFCYFCIQVSRLVINFLAHLSKKCSVSFCDPSMSGVRRWRVSVCASVNNFFKQHLLWNRLLDFDQTLQKWSLGGPLSKLLRTVPVGCISKSWGQIFFSKCNIQKISCPKLQGPELSYLVYSII